MKNLIASMLIIASFSLANAQLRTPAPSPYVKTEQSVGLETITLEYSRPGAKGREIFGELVPFEKIWRTGANQSTKITFSDDVTFNGSKVKRGTYALYTIPGKKTWTVMLNTDLTVGGAVDRYSKDTEVHRSEVDVTKVKDHVESFMIYLDDLRDASATLNLTWEKTLIQIPIGLNTDEKVMAGIERVMAGPNDRDYYQAAVYYYNSGKDLDKAYEWISKATEMNPDAYWVATWKARILAKQGRKEEAAAAAKIAMEKAEKAGNQDFVKINADIIKEMK